MEINAQLDGPGQPQLYPWPGTGQMYPWPQILRLWGSEIASKQPGEAGVFICDKLQQLADEATTWNLATPEMHAQHQTDQATHEAAYIAQLERDAAWDPGDEPESQYDPRDPASTGSLLGHPAGEDDFPLQVWLGDQSCDDTYSN